MVRSIATAVAAAHAHGVVHRDLKPGNVLLTPDGTPKVTDFGLAKRLDDDSGQTRTGAVMGTPAYMAPEQASGHKDVGPLADLYALGAILYEALTGAPPFRGATVLDTLDQVRTREPVAVRVHQPKVARDLETVCLKCLSKDPRKRYESADALAADLGRWLAGKPILARRARVWEKVYRMVCRNPIVSALVSVVAVAVIGGVAGVVWQWQQTQTALERAETNLYFQRVGVADRETQAGNTDRADLSLDACPPHLRGWEWYYLKRRCHTPWVRLSGHTDLVRCVAYNRDGTRLASCGNDGTVRLWDVTGGRPPLVLNHGAWVHVVAFDSEGRTLISAGEDGRVKVWDVADGRVLKEVNYGSVFVTVSADGRQVASLQNDGLRIHDPESGEVRVKIRGQHSHDKVIAFSHNGRFVSAVLDSELRIWDVRSGEVFSSLRGQARNGVFSLTFAPDSRLLYAGHLLDRHPVLDVWEVATGLPVPDAHSSPMSLKVVALSPDGRSLATGGYEGGVKVRDISTGRDLQSLRTFDDAVVSLTYRPDSQGVAAAVGRDVWLRAWGGEKDRGPVAVQRHAGGVASVAFRPDGRVIASCGADDLIQFREVGSGQATIRSNTGAGGHTTVAYSPDGRRVLAVGRDGAVYTWDATGVQPGPVLRIPSSKLTEAVFSPDSDRIATAGSDRTMRVWDAATGGEVFAVSGHTAEVRAVRFSPDGRRIATAGSDHTVRLWEADTGLALAEFQGHQSHIQSVAFHPDGELLATASTDETVRLWDISSSVEVYGSPLRGHTGPVCGLSFSPDGRRLASASEDGNVRLWDVATRQEALTLSDPGKVRGVAFSPDGRTLAAASSDGAVRIWDAAPLEK